MVYFLKFLHMQTNFTAFEDVKTDDKIPKYVFYSDDQIISAINWTRENKNKKQLFSSTIVFLFSLSNQLDNVRHKRSRLEVLLPKIYPLKSSTSIRMQSGHKIIHFDGDEADKVRSTICRCGLVLSFILSGALWNGERTVCACVIGVWDLSVGFGRTCVVTVNW